MFKESSFQPQISRTRENAIHLGVIYNLAKHHWNYLIQRFVQLNAERYDKARSGFHSIQSQSDKHKIPFKRKKYNAQLGFDENEKKRRGKSV